MKIVLASNSPRRKELLTKFGYQFEVIKSNFDEGTAPKMSAKKTPKFLAYSKAINVYKTIVDKNSIVIGADTVVVFKKNIIGKPKDKQDAVNTLKQLSGKKHFVYTGYAIITKDKIINKVCKSTVYFNILSDDMIKKYVESGLPLDKAGSYGIQDGFPIVKKYKGSFNNIVGLPIEKIDKILKKIISY